MLRLLGVSLSALALLWLVWARVTRPQRDGWNQLMHSARQYLQRTGIESSASQSPRSLAHSVQKRWSQDCTPQASALSDWLLDMERLRYAPSNSQESLELKKMRQRWLALKKQSWPLASSQKNQKHEQSL